MPRSTTIFSQLFPGSPAEPRQAQRSAEGNCTDMPRWWVSEKVFEVDASGQPLYVKHTITPELCPAAATIEFWQTEALQQSSGMDELGASNERARDLAAGKWSRAKTRDVWNTNSGVARPMLGSRRRAWTRLVAHLTSSPPRLPYPDPDLDCPTPTLTLTARPRP